MHRAKALGTDVLPTSSFWRFIVLKPTVRGGRDDQRTDRPGRGRGTLRKRRKGGAWGRQLSLDPFPTWCAGLGPLEHLSARLAAARLVTLGFLLIISTITLQ